MERITTKKLEAVVLLLNKELGRPLEPYVLDKKRNRHVAQVGNFHTYNAYERVGLDEMANDSGAARRVVDLGTNRELFNAIHLLLKGIRFERVRKAVAMGWAFDPTG